MRLIANRAQAAISLVLLLAASAMASDWDRGVALYNKAEFRAALVEFQDIVMERPDAAGAWYYIGLCEFKLKRYDRVECRCLMPSICSRFKRPRAPTSQARGTR